VLNPHIFPPKTCTVRKNVLPLHPQTRNNGTAAAARQSRKLKDVNLQNKILSVQKFVVTLQTLSAIADTENIETFTIE
jgi:hypothetical protein